MCERVVVTDCVCDCSSRCCRYSGAFLSLRDSFKVSLLISLFLRRRLFIFFCCRLGSSKFAPISSSHSDSHGVATGECICIGEVACTVPGDCISIGEVACTVPSDSTLESMLVAFSASRMCSSWLSFCRMFICFSIVLTFSSREFTFCSSSSMLSKFTSRCDASPPSIEESASPVLSLFCDNIRILSRSLVGRPFVIHSPNDHISLQGMVT